MEKELVLTPAEIELVKVHRVLPDHMKRAIALMVETYRPRKREAKIISFPTQEKEETR